MKYMYKIIYDIDKDMWNWRGGTKDSFFGQATIDRIENIDDKNIANRISSLNKKPAEIILKPYLKSKKNNPNSDLNKFIKIAEKDFSEKYVDACKALEKITKRPMVSKEFIFYVTTFPRMTVFFDSFEIFMYASTKGVWGMPIDGFLHEAHHFQFNHYWRQNPDSPVSKLSEEEFTYLKEALVITQDEDLKPLVTICDNGYASQRDFCELLHRYWKKYHDFDKLVDFGLVNLRKYIKKTGENDS